MNTSSTTKVSKSAESTSWTESKSKKSQTDLEFNWRVRQEPIFDEEN